MGRGTGKIGYYNLAPMDAHIHSLSAKGVSTYAKRVVSEGFYHTSMGDVETWEKVDDKTYESECSDCGYIGGGFYEVSGKDLWDSYSYGVCPKCSNNKDMVKVIKNIIKNKDKSDIDLAKEFMASFNDDWDKLEQYQKDEAIKYIKGIKKDKDKFSLDAKGVKGQKYHIDVDFEGERLVDDVVVLETPQKNEKKVLVHSPKLLADIRVNRNELFAKGKCDIVSHLKHSKLPDSKFDKVQLKKGIGVETEHTTSKKVAKAISKAHLLENPDYYKKFNPKKKTKDFLMNAKGEKEYKAGLIISPYGGKKFMWQLEDNVDRLSCEVYEFERITAKNKQDAVNKLNEKYSQNPKYKNLLRKKPFGWGEGWW